MIQATMRMNSGGDEQVCAALRSLCDMVAGRPGCLSCEILQRLDCPEQLVYVEQWEDWDSLRIHLKSETYAYLLQILELSAERPELEFQEVSNARGLEFVEAVRLGVVEEGRFRSPRQHVA